jgi:hypothetical protein
VLLGDVIELRHGPVRDALVVAKPVLQAVGAALGPQAEVIVLAGNHDHALVGAWLDARGADEPPPPLQLEERVPPWNASPIAAAIAAALAPANCSFAYPGVWLRDDVYATHGHYYDLHVTVPTIERLAAGVMARIAGGLPRGRCEPDDYEAILAPLYAWNHAAAQRFPHGRTRARGASSEKVWRLLNGDGHRPVRRRILAGAFPLGVIAANAVGLGPVKADISTAELRRAALVAMGEVVQRLDVRARHVVFGHSHRAGPLPQDDVSEWCAPGGALLHNAGCWTYEDAFLRRSSAASPYWPGCAVVIDDDGPPRVERLLEAMPVQELRAAAA